MTTTESGAARAEASEQQAAGRPLLRRSRTDRVLFGVCGGLSRYLGIDPVLVRIAFVLLAVFGGSGVLLYLIALIAIPTEESGEAAESAAPAGSGVAVTNGAGVVLGAVLVAVGALLLAGRVVPAFGELFAPLVLLAMGVVVILAARR
jgi:phage shock protein C